MDYPKQDVEARLQNGKFTDGDSVNAIPPSRDSATYQNAVYDELLSVITSAGLTPDVAVLNQLSTAVNKISTDIATSIVNAAINNIVDGAPAALDTLKELGAALDNNKDFAATITTALNGKAALSHSHSINDIVNLTAALNSKAASSHSHSMSEVSGLAPALNAKASQAQISSINNALNSKLNINRFSSELHSNFSNRVMRASSGFIKLPGDLTIQWGQRSVGPGTTTVTFVQAFFRDCNIVVASPGGRNSGGSALAYFAVSNFTQSSFDITSSFSNNQTVMFIAIGY